MFLFRVCWLWSSGISTGRFACNSGCSKTYWFPAWRHDAMCCNQYWCSKPGKRPTDYINIVPKPPNPVLAHFQPAPMSCSSGATMRDADTSLGQAPLLRNQTHVTHATSDDSLSQLCVAPRNQTVCCVTPLLLSTPLSRACTVLSSTQSLRLTEYVKQKHRSKTPRLSA